MTLRAIGKSRFAKDPDGFNFRLAARYAKLSETPALQSALLIQGRAVIRLCSHCNLLVETVRPAHHARDLREAS